MKASIICGINLLILWLGNREFWLSIDFPEYIASVSTTVLVFLQVKKLVNSRKYLLLSVTTLFGFVILVNLNFIYLIILIFIGYKLNLLSWKKHNRELQIINISVYPLARATNPEMPKANELDIYFTILSLIIFLLLAFSDINSFFTNKNMPLYPYSEWCLY